MFAPILVIALVAFAPIASAHQTSVKYIDLATHDRTVSVTVKCAAGDVTEPMHLPADAAPTVADAVAQHDVAVWVQTWFSIAGCTQAAPVAAPVDDRFLAVTWTATCESTRQLTLDFTRFFALDRRHEAIVRLEAGGAAPIQTIVRASDPQLVLRAGEAPSLLAWIRTGMDHIYTGIDHILFVISLLLVVMLYRAADDWKLRGFVLTLRSTAVVITAFTIAHSISLIAASLGYVTLPSRFVESMIALSIAYTAIEDIAKPDVRWRFFLTFGFGLVHGLGFAATLAELLPPSDVVVPLLCFNVGVEIGQLSIVLVALPLAFLLARLVGAPAYRRYALPVLAGAIAIAGLAMFAQRIR
ncbi:MAG TPA: HupE/UreJ family protein [Kofleriaceae bacterium]|nr:HupE/UreJ family protein [Kofleriaceae bacterium]